MSFADMLSKEDQLQVSVMNYIALKYPKALAIHVHNESHRATKFQRYKAKVLGMKSGVPDVLVFDPVAAHSGKYKQYRPEYSGLAIELKIKPNKITPTQKKFLDDLDQRGWKTAVCYNIDEAMQVIDDYFR